MDFQMVIDDAARTNLPGVSARNSAATVSDTELEVHLGDLFELHAGRGQVAAAQQIDDPKPTVFLPLGVSAAAERFADQTIAVIGSHEGLVMVDFTDTVDARKVVPEHDDSESDSGPRGIQVRHLILSLKDPQGFVEALGQRASATASAVSSTA
ncbi:MAG TPA: hypothetical protein VF898_05175 [Chloroflexota bacterium]